MIYFTDVDIVIKLARWGFLDSLAGLIDSEQKFEAEFLPSLKSRIARPNKRKEIGKDAVGSLETFCETHEAVGAPQNPARVETLIDSGMDAGEALLIARAEETGGVVVTGDKRALKHYAAHSTKAQRSKIRVICLEMVLLRIHQLEGYDVLCGGCCRDLEADPGMMKIAFRDGVDSKEENVIGWFESCLREVKVHSSDILFEFPAEP